MTVTALATAADVVKRLGRPLTAEEQIRVDGLLDEASDLVLGHLPCDLTAADPATSKRVARVVSRMVARVLQLTDSTGDASSGGGGVFGVTQMTDQIGDFSQSRSFAPGSTSGGPWLSKSDKQALRGVCGSGDAFAIDTAPGFGPVHAQTCSVVFGAAWCDCGSAVNAGQGPVPGAV